MIGHEVDDMNFVLDVCNLMKYEEENFKEFLSNICELTVDESVTLFLFLL